MATEEYKSTDLNLLMEAAMLYLESDYILNGGLADLQTWLARFNQMKVCLLRIAQDKGDLHEALEELGDFISAFEVKRATIIAIWELIKEATRERKFAEHELVFLSDFAQRTGTEASTLKWIETRV